MKYLIVVLGFISLALLNPISRTNNDYQISQTDYKGDGIITYQVSTATELSAPKALDQPAAQLALAPVSVTPMALASATISGCGDSTYANEVYMLESHCNLTAVNASSGDCGIGQAGPCSKLISACPDWQTDYNCQNGFFTNYMSSRYGSWASAWGHELTNNWW